MHRSRVVHLVMMSQRVAAISVVGMFDVAMLDVIEDLSQRHLVTPVEATVAATVVAATVVAVTVVAFVPRDGKTQGVAKIKPIHTQHNSRSSPVKGGQWLMTYRITVRSLFDRLIQLMWQYFVLLLGLLL